MVCGLVFRDCDCMLRKHREAYIIDKEYATTCPFGSGDWVKEGLFIGALTPWHANKGIFVDFSHFTCETVHTPLYLWLAKGLVFLGDTCCPAVRFRSVSHGIEHVTCSGFWSGRANKCKVVNRFAGAWPRVQFLTLAAPLPPADLRG